MMQPFPFQSGNTSASESDATEMHLLDNRRQRGSRRRQSNSAQSDDTDDMDDPATSSAVASTDFNFLGSLSPLQKKHKMRSFEKLEVEGFDDGGNLSDSSLPSARQSLARSRHPDVDIHEGTPLLSRQHSTTDLQRVEQALDGEEDDVVELTPRNKRKHAIKKYGTQIKISILFIIMLASVIMFASKDDEKDGPGIIAITSSQNFTHGHDMHNPHRRILLTIDGPFGEKPTGIKGPFNSTSSCENEIENCMEVCSISNIAENCYRTKVFNQRLVTDNSSVELEFINSHKIESLNFTYSLITPGEDFIVQFETSFESFEISFNEQVGIAASILVFVYLLIVFELVHRVVAALIGSTVAIAALTMVGHRPTLLEVIDHIQFDTICLLFGMMILVAIFSQTGFFDYAAVKMYKLARGHSWMLLFLLCLFSGVVSAFIDNVTTILLLTPVSIRLCQVLNLDPRYVLIAEVVFSNIGGTGTAIGDPPNIIIISHQDIKDAGINFPEFTLHLAIGIFFCMLAGFILIRLLYWRLSLKNKDLPEVAELKREIAIWKRTARHMRVVSLEERGVRDLLLRKAQEVQLQLREQLNHNAQTNTELWKKNLETLEGKYKITDKVLLAKSSIVLAVVILSFFLLHTIPNVHIDLGWIALFGSLILLILADVDELETVLEKVEWATLLFFAGLFVLMEILAELGLIKFIGDKTVELIKTVDREHQLLVAILLIVWVSAIASSFIDNIPFTTAMIPVIIELGEDESVCVPLKPLVWSLALGACLGGNGTLIGASANVVCAGLAEQNGYPISFMKFFKVGFPMMLGTTFVATVYLIICHVALDWDNSDINECINRNLTANSAQIF